MQCNLFSLSRRKFQLNLGDSDVDSHPFLQHVVWAPRGNALAFVYRNDIYYKTSALTSLVYRVTNTGRPGVVFNGVPDWLYEGKTTNKLFESFNKCRFREYFHYMAV
jgi:hypothetical protein